MSPEELDQALEDLEVRLERLRALYEQYFLGFEKIEPAVARKEVDRRIYVMRREKIRNTGKRFKLQTLIQRYNTFQQYWQRICREIENGTYKRHLLRAERQLSPEQQLTIAARRRFGRTGSIPPPAAVVAAAAADARSSRPAAPEPAAAGATVNVPPPAPLPGATQLSAARGPTPVPPERRAAAPAPTRPPKYESLELDMGFLGSWVPPAATPPRPVASPPQPVSPRPAERPPIERPAKQKSSPTAAHPPAARAVPVARIQPPPKPARPAAAAGGGMTDDRVKELHQKLNRMKKDNREAGQVSFESLAKTIRATENQLKAQYKNRKIDFDVVLKDGKAIVKPKVR